jgi:hypothetical protein
MAREDARPAHQQVNSDQESSGAVRHNRSLGVRSDGTGRSGERARAGY